MKKAILVVSFGASHAETEQLYIHPIEAALKHAFPEYEICRAYTSRTIIDKLRSRGIRIDNETEALAKLQAEGYEQIAIVPTHLLHGREYEQVKAAAGIHPISETLLENEDDLEWMAALLGRIAAAEKRPLLMMGHGSGHGNDDTYTRLCKILPQNVYLACAEGEHKLEDLLYVLEKLPESGITLMPLMLTAGSHARIDMAGEGENSWKSILESKGFEVHVRMQGLGALPEVQERYVQKTRRILN